jgi:hypothetical protein
VIGRVTKADLVWEVAGLLAVTAPPMSTGSTEPRVIFDLIDDRLGLGVTARRTKPEAARAIVEAAGFAWQPTYESRGGTVTLEGLVAVVRAVRFFLDAPATQDAPSARVGLKAEA